MKTTPAYVFFYGMKDIYSNFHPVDFIHQGQRFFCSEQAVMYRKAKLFGADKIAKQIVKAKTPNEAKSLGRSKQIAFNEEVWIANREQVYYEVLVDKFSVPKLKDALLRTGKRTLVEASPSDTIWGIGLAESNPLIQYPAQWKGLNLLGKTLMRVRDTLNLPQVDSAKKATV